MRPTINVIDDHLVAEILDEARRILGEIGVEVRGARLRRRLLDHGLPIDRHTDRILFPPDVVNQAISDAPGSFTLYDRDGQPHAELGGDNVHFVPGSSGLKVLDHRTGETRLANTRDFAEYVRLADGLPNIAYLATAFSTDDIEAQVSDAWRLYLCLIHSTKPVVSGAFTEHGVPRMAQMMELFRQDRQDLTRRPMAIFTITATGMFRYSEDSCQNLLDCVEAGIPIEIVPVTLMGLIAPVTLVGATVFHTADVLAGLTMAQLLKPGAPVLFGGAPAAFHMRAATSPMIAVEALHLDMAYIAVAKSLGLPTQSYLALSEAKFLDAQAGAETYGSALLAALAGVNSVSGPGMLDYLLVFSLEKLLFDDALCGQALHFIRDMKPKDDLPTVDLARRLLEEQHLITAEHTMEHWPQELYLPDPVVDRQNRENWTKAGAPTLKQRVRAEVDRRLAVYTPPPLDNALKVELQQIITADMSEDAPLPQVPPMPAGKSTPRRRRTRRQTRRNQE